jgi:hypothetical protein
VGITVPEVPAGVRPVTGTHFSRIPLGRAPREWRRVANLAAVGARRVRRRPVRLPDAPPYRKVFVVGCGRSGTSWVQGILASHPLVVSSQESHAYENVFEPVSARGAHSVTGWTKVVHRHDVSEREARWVGLHWWVNRRALLDFTEWAMATDGPGAAEVAERVIDAIFDSYFLGRGGTAEHVLVEKTPGHLHHAGRILRRDPRARVVEVVRDGRDVCVSMQMQALTVDWPPTARAAQIDAWVRAVERGRALRGDPALADRVHRVRYEDLEADPRGEITRLLAFAGLDADAGLLDEIVDRADFRHHRSTGDGHHTRRGESGDWRNHFTADDEALFRERAGAVFEAAGYRF